jgi:hypothetical protein
VQKKSSQNFSVKKNVVEFQRKKIWLQNFSAKKIRCENFSAKNLVAEISAEKIVVKFRRKKFGCENSAKKKCRGISAEKISSRNFGGKK